MLLANIAGIQNSIGWTVESSTGYTSSGPTIVPRVGDPFYGSDYLGLSRYGSPTNTDINILRDQLQALINKGPAPYQLQTSLIEKVLRDNVQNWNFLYPNGTSPQPRPWVQDFGDALQIILTDDGRLTFDRDGEPPHNHPKIHHMVDNVNYYVQQFSDAPYIVLIDHLKRLGKGWRTPQEGSLWHVIHSGDVNIQRLTSIADKIPLLKSFLQNYGVNLDSLKQYATQYLQPGGNVTLPPGTVSPTLATKASVSTMNPMLLAALAGGAAWYLTKKPLYGGLAFLAAMMLNRNSQTFKQNL